MTCTFARERQVGRKKHGLQFFFFLIHTLSFGYCSMVFRTGVSRAFLCPELILTYFYTSYYTLALMFTYVLKADRIPLIDIHDR